MSSVNIRRALEEDFSVITDLWQEMMEYHLSLDSRFELAYDSREAYMEYLHSIQGNFEYIILVAEEEKRVVGYTIGMILSNPAVFALARYGFIAEMAVAQDFQHAGVGKQLWEYIRRWFYRRGVAVIQLNVSPENKKGYEFWKKMGCHEFLHIMWHDIPRKLS